MWSDDGTHPEKLLKSTIVNFLCKLQDDDCLKRATTEFNKIPSGYFTNPSGNPYVVQATCLEYLKTVDHDSSILGPFRIYAQSSTSTTFKARTPRRTGFPCSYSTRTPKTRMNSNASSKRSATHGPCGNLTRSPASVCVLFDWFVKKTIFFMFEVIWKRFFNMKRKSIPNTQRGRTFSRS